MEFFSIRSGSSGNCICIGDRDHHVLIDAGISGKKIEEGLNEKDLSSSDIDGILVTHEHIDHVSSLGVMARRYHLPIYATALTISAIKSMNSLGKIDPELFHPIEKDMDFMIGDLKVRAIHTSHDAADPVAYMVEAADGKKAGVLTDLGVYDDYVIDNMRDKNVILLEANHDKRMLESGPYPYSLKVRIMGERGHLSNDASGKLLSELLNDGINHVFLGHLSHENNYPEIALATVGDEVTLSDNKYKADDFPITIAGRESSTLKIEF